MECNSGFYRILRIMLSYTKSFPLVNMYKKAAEAADLAVRRNELEQTIKFQPYFDPRNLFSKMMQADNEEGFSKENA